MRIGFTSIYSWRPHVEHLKFLADLACEAGHQVEFLTCDSNLPACYTRELRSIRPDWQECLMCRLGGVRSYASHNVSSIGRYDQSNYTLPDGADTWGLSSASTLGRFESDEDFSSEEFHRLAKRLQPTVEKAYRAALGWIDDRKLEALVVFNGRMDATRAIFEAALHRQIPVASLERPWFSNGLQILPQENCLGLRAVDRLVADWAGRPLTKTQALRSASHIASRFLRRNQVEWRAYNVEAQKEPWPVSDGRCKILLIPGSRNEFWGHPDWTSGWKHPIEGYDAIIDHLGLSPRDLVLRCHPNWGEKIGQVDGQRPEEYYSKWAKSRGIHVIPSGSKTSTLGLIGQADAIVVASGSAALEAGALGKQVISIAASSYRSAQIRDDATDVSQLASLTLMSARPADEYQELSDRIRRQTLRYCYTMSHRAAQYVDYVRALSPTNYAYKEGADPRQFLEILQSGVLIPDDDVYSKVYDDESDVLEIMKSESWDALHAPSTLGASYRRRTRRPMYRWVDAVRDKMRRGDR